MPHITQTTQNRHTSHAPSANPANPTNSACSANQANQALKPPLLVAEISANHNQNLALALKTIESAKRAGADFVKLQTYTPDSLTIDSSAPYFRIDSGTAWDGQTLYELYKQAYTPFEWHKELFAHARAMGIGIFSSPFCARGVELLERLECPMYKIASFEITDIALISLVASTRKPIIISTGIATRELIVDALEACEMAGNSDITLLHCISEYPAKLEDANILAMPNLARYGVKYGLSDHTIGASDGDRGCADLCAILAASLGASMIEKHFIISRSLGGVDSHFSMEEAEFATMANRVRAVSVAMGGSLAKQDFANKDNDFAKSIKSSDFANATNNTKTKNNPKSHTINQDEIKHYKSKSPFARSLFVCDDIAMGEVLNAQNIRSIRPSDGLPPRYLPKILGAKATRDLKRGEPLKIGDFE